MNCYLTPSYGLSVWNMPDICVHTGFKKPYLILIHPAPLVKIIPAYKQSKAGIYIYYYYKPKCRYLENSYILADYYLTPTQTLLDQLLEYVLHLCVHRVLRNFILLSNHGFLVTFILPPFIQLISAHKQS